jgi:hypothetical protein
MYVLVDRSSERRLLDCHPDRSGGIARRCGAHAEILSENRRPIGALAPVSTDRGCAPKTGRDPSAGLGMTETAIARILVERRGLLSKEP